MKIFKAFENITEVLAWLQIVISFTLIGSGIGALIYFTNQNVIMLVIGIFIALVGLIFGIGYATKMWKTKGTVWFISRVSASPELDNDEIKKEN